MSKVLILGAAGMVGQKLTQHLVSNPTGLVISELVLHDIIAAPKPSDTATPTFAIDIRTGNIADADQSVQLAALRPDIIFHLAAIVSGDAEKNFDKGWNINARGAWQLLEALRTEHEQSAGQYRPRVIFASSIAVFGGPYPEKISDDFLCAPQTSYGAQKAMTELLIADYARKGYIDGLSLRLPTICVRPGKPNLAASSFFSGIIREPLNGQEAILPVAEHVRHWHASPRSAASFFAHAAQLDTTALKGRYTLNLPGVSCTVAEQIAALRDIAGNEVVKLIKHRPDETIRTIVSGWPCDFDPQRAITLGFKAENDFKEIIAIYIADDLPKAAA